MGSFRKRDRRVPQPPVTVLGEHRGGRESSKRVHKAPGAAPLTRAWQLPRLTQKESAAGAERWAAGHGRGREQGSPRGRSRAGRPAARVVARSRVRARPHQLSARRVSRGACVEGHSALTMELSEFVQKGFQLLADPGSFDSNAFTLLLRAAFQSLLDAQADEAVLGKPLGYELDRPGWRGTRRRAERPSERGKAPGRGSLPALPFAPDGVWGCGSATTQSGP